ncbi:MAG: SpoIVB peptidase S55 domain-containing protein, partial [Faecousia sp.]
IPVGEIIGLQLRDDTVTVAAYDDLLGEKAKNAGLKIGDEIVSINGTAIDCAEDVRSALSSGGQAELTVRRGGKLNTLHITPEQTSEGPRLGVYLRQGIAGIGTVTFYDPETGVFGTLGHGVSDPRGNLLRMTQGSAYEAQILSVKKGKSGEPGQLKGTADGANTFGNLLRNTPQGVFGVTKQGWKGEPIPVASYEEIHTGAAFIRSTVSGDTAQDYSVEILKIYPEDRADGRNFLIKVVDPALLDATGGIVQGMSGSPIIQDGRLIGAVTHVLVNDPTAGYGIFIENMLDAAG